MTLHSKSMMADDYYHLHNVDDTLQILAQTPAIRIAILGETGTSKTVLARQIHTMSRVNGPFVSINCTAITSTLAESEFFGHKKGSFTGAGNDSCGKIEAANNGTLFLDEIADMHPEIQAKLLTFLDDGRFYPVGSSIPKESDVRIISATNRDPQAAIKEGKLRQDLYYRLAHFETRLPALREQPDKILPLAEHMLGKIARDQNKPLKALSAAARDAVLHYTWPGNLRELNSRLQVAFALACRVPEIEIEHLKLPSETISSMVEEEMAKIVRLAAVAGKSDLLRTFQDVSLKTLTQMDKSKKEMSEILGVAPRTVHNYGLLAS